MNQHGAHPDDTTLFDLIEGSLDPAVAADVEAHLDACETCGQLVLAAINGSPDRFSPVEQMPEPAAQRMYQALAGAWAERLEVMGAATAAPSMPAAPAVAELAPQPLGPAAVPEPPRQAEVIRPRFGRRELWTRRVMPALAAAVVITLGGVTLHLQERVPGKLSPSATPEAAQPVVGEVEEGSSLSMPSGGESGGGSAGAAAVNSSATVMSADDVVGDGLVCIANVDPGQLALPDNRIPQRTLQGPLGIYVVCG